MGDARLMFSVDLVGSALLVDAFRPIMAAGGSAVLFGSMAAYLIGDPQGEVADILAEPLADGAAERFAGSDAVGGDPGVAYGWAKRGVLALVRREAAAWAAGGARINSVSPGSIATPMGRQEIAGQPMMRLLLEQTPLGRMGDEKDVVEAVDFLLSDRAAYITGTDLLIDGGVVAALTTGAVDLGSS